MKTLQTWCFVVLFLCVSTQNGLGSDLKQVVDQLIVNLRNNFGQLTEKRTQWLANHDEMKGTLMKDHESLEEILKNSKKAVHFIWNSYAGFQLIQRGRSESELISGKAQIPVVAEFVSKKEGFLLEVILDSGLNAIEIKIEERGRPELLAVVRVDPEQRTMTLLDGPVNDLVERALQSSEDFPSKEAFDGPFKVSVQAWGRCVFLSLWTGDLSFRTPAPLPKKIHWCRSMLMESVTADTTYQVNVTSRHPDADCHGVEVFCDSKREPLNEVVSAKVYHTLIFG
ncbi:uncharacterized protein LOC143039992 [Oratosquilla oratoria]|uniref:uncharacterized protein LOC143039992 n=1 Tax=Oratosquilla oratoria TaxID=337810 RepID=UPI003F7691BF